MGGVRESPDVSPGAEVSDGREGEEDESEPDSVSRDGGAAGWNFTGTLRLLLRLEDLLKDKSVRVC